MTAVQPLRDMKAERLTDNFAPQERIETEKPKTPMEWYDQFCREFIECQRQDGTPDEDIITMPEVVAICKEVRAERYERKQKETACR